MNWRTHLRNEVELSPQRFLPESSTKGVSAQDLRSKFQVIYHVGFVSQKQGVVRLVYEVQATAK